MLMWKVGVLLLLWKKILCMWVVCWKLVSVVGDIGLVLLLVGWKF